MSTWLACIVTKNGERRYVDKLVPDYTTTTDKTAADRFPTSDVARKVARLCCPPGGRYGAEPAERAPGKGCP